MKPSPEQVREWAKKAGAKFDPHWGIAYNTGTATFERFAELAAQWGAEQAQHEAENAPWLTTAHTICTDAGIAHGPISGRLEALRDKLADKAQQTTEETDAEMALRSIASWLGVGGFNAPTVDAKAFEQKIYEGVEMAIKSHYATAEEPELPEAAETLQIPDTALGRDYDSITKVIFHLSMAKREPGWLVGACWLASSILERIKALGPLYTAAQMHDHYQAGVRAGMAQSQDARRYQWLRDSGFAYANVDLGTDLDGDNFVRYQIRFDIPEPAHSKFEDDEWSASDIDAAIDSAMQKGQK